MMYPCSPSTRSLAVPGICYCQNISVDQDPLDQAYARAWSSARARVHASDDRACQGPSETQVR